MREQTAVLVQQQNASLDARLAAVEHILERMAKQQALQERQGRLSLARLYLRNSNQAWR